MTLIWQPDEITELFRTDRTMPVRASRTLLPLVGASSLLFANGEEHTRHRRSLGPALRGNALLPARSVISEALAAHGMPSRFQLTAWTRALTMRVIGRMVLGAVDEVVFGTFTDWIDSALGSRRRALTFRYFGPRKGFLRRRAALERDLLAMARPDALANGRPEQVVSLLFAGHETTASALAWTLFWLSRNDTVREHIRDELAVTSDDGSSARAVPLLDAACRESLRLSPPATVAGHRMQPDGTRRTPAIAVAHRNPAVYPCPERFAPERFLGHGPVTGAYFPFGGGARRCLGAELALLELRMIVAAVLRETSLRCVNPRAGVPHLRGPAMGPKPTLTVVRC